MLFFKSTPPLHPPDFHSSLNQTEVEFLDITLTKDSSLFLHAIHRPFYKLILQKKHTLLRFLKTVPEKSAKQEKSISGIKYEQSMESSPPGPIKVSFFKAGIHFSSTSYLLNSQRKGILYSQFFLNCSPHPAVENQFYDGIDFSQGNDSVEQIPIFIGIDSMKGGDFHGFAIIQCS